MMGPLSPWTKEASLLLLLLVLCCGQLLALTEASTASAQSLRTSDATAIDTASTVVHGQQHRSPPAFQAMRGTGISDVLESHATAPAVHSSWQQHPQQQQENSHSSQGSSSTARHLNQVGPVYADMPGDLMGLESILAAARDAFGYFEPGALQSQRPSAPQQYVPRSRALGATQSRSTPGTVTLVITFESAHPGVEVRLPGLLRGFNVSVVPYGSTPSLQQQGGCSFSRLQYFDQEVDCPGLTVGSQWEATLVDADSDDLVLATTNFTVAGSTVDIPVELGLMSVEASFDRLAWAGMYYPRPRHSTSTILIHAIIVGAQVVIYTRQGGQEVVWDMQWTGSEGTTSFFLVPGVRSVFWANMSVGETVLRTAPITPELPLSIYHDTVPTFDGESLPQVQQQQLTAVPQLLCTGEVEDVRGDAGTFPQSLAPLEVDGDIYHPRGFTCRWELTPDQADVLLSVDYRGLMPDESITLELAPNNIIRLNSPEGGPGAVFQASVWVEHSILVSFQTTRLSTEKVGAFSISWTSVASSRSNGVLDSKTMVVVLSCVSAAGALLAACCFYFVCCGRRRRAGGVVVDGELGSGGVQLARVPSAVRELLPSKPYQAPEANPLPGAETEPDCCSICLVELEAGELVTVLPCMHFYHKECIGSWLKRNCTCPLCKNNVLEAFKVQQFEARQARRNRRRGIAPTTAPTAEAVSSDGSGTPTSSSTGGGSSHGAAHAQQQQPLHIQMTALEPLGGTRAAAASPAAGLNSSRSTSPWPPLDQHAHAAAAMPSHADTGAAGGLSAPAGMRPLRLPPLQHPQQQQHPAAMPQLVIPPSPSASMVSLQSGTVLATPEDFAPAAAAAAAHTAADMAGRQRSTSPIAEAAASAAQASVAAVRTSSRTLSRRLHVLLSPRTAAGAGTDGTAGDPAGSQSGVSLASSRGGSPLPTLLPAGPSAGAGPHRVAVSIYAYAGHPIGTEEDAGQQQDGSQLAAGSPHQAITVLTLPGAVEDRRDEQLRARHTQQH